MILHGPCNGPCYGPCGPCIIYNGLCNSLRRGPVTVPETSLKYNYLHRSLQRSLITRARRALAQINVLIKTTAYVQSVSCKRYWKHMCEEQLKTYVRRTREQYPLLGWGHCGAHMSHARCVCVLQAARSFFLSSLNCHFPAHMLC